jgi:hypothetical protein
VEPPAGVKFALRTAKNELVAPTRQSVGEVSFDVQVTLNGAKPDGTPNLLGPATHRRPYGRVLVVNSGTLAGQRDSCWTRAALVPLNAFDWKLIEVAKQGGVLEARMPGTAGDGGPICATVKPITWQIS